MMFPFVTYDYTLFVMITLMICVITTFITLILIIVTIFNFIQSVLNYIHYSTTTTTLLVHYSTTGTYYISFYVGTYAIEYIHYQQLPLYQDRYIIDTSPSIYLMDSLILEEYIYIITGIQILSISQ